MKYYRSGKTYKNYKPKKNWRGFSLPKKRRVRQYDESTAALRYSNPFARTRPKFSFKIKKYILPVLILTWIGFLLYLPEFQVTNIKYSGLNIIKPDEMTEAIKGQYFAKNSFIPKNNYFLLSEDSIKFFLNEKYSLNQITVTKSFPNTLFIDVKESASSAIYDNGSEYYLLNDLGVSIKYLKSNPIPEQMLVNASSTTQISSTIFASSTISTTSTSIVKHTPDYNAIKSEFGDLPIVYDLNEPTVREKQAVIDSSTLKALISFYNGLEKGKVAKVSYMTFKDPTAGITVYLDKPWKVLFKPSENIDEQLNNLQVTLKNSRPTEYVDLRYGDRIYWK